MHSDLVFLHVLTTQSLRELNTPKNFFLLYSLNFYISSAHYNEVRQMCSDKQVFGGNVWLPSLVMFTSKISYIWNCIMLHYPRFDSGLISTEPLHPGTNLVKISDLVFMHVLKAIWCQNYADENLLVDLNHCCENIIWWQIQTALACPTNISTLCEPYFQHFE